MKKLKKFFPRSDQSVHTNFLQEQGKLEISLQQQFLSKQNTIFLKQSKNERTNPQAQEFNSNACQVLLPLG